MRQNTVEWIHHPSSAMPIQPKSGTKQHPLKVLNTDIQESKRGGRKITKQRWTLMPRRQRSCRRHL